MTGERKELFSEKVSAGSRKYFFDVKKSVDGAKYLAISESRQVGGESYEHNRVMVFQEHLTAFKEGFNKAVKFMKPKSNELKLKIELVPSTSWYNNLRKVLPRSDWDKIRKKAYAKYGYRCGICGAKGRLNCHEVWEYDDKKHIQKLLGFIALCSMCHHVKHIGLVLAKGIVDYEKVVEHFMKVNNCDKETFEEHEESAFDKLDKRSQHEWHLDLGEYENIIQGTSKKG